MKTSAEVNAIFPALIKAQGTIGAAVRNSFNPHFKSRYSDLATVIEAVKGPLQQQGLAIIQAPCGGPDGLAGITTRLIHTSGQWLESVAYAPLGKRADAPAAGSVYTYLKRYSIAALCLLPDADDDGRAAMLVTADQEPQEPQGPAVISEQQRITIETMTAQLAVDMKRFLFHFGVDSIAEILATDYDKIIAMLEAKAARAQ